MHAVFEASGREGRIGEVDLMRYRDWLEKGHNDALILEAAAQARSARKKIAYMDKVLLSWQKKGIRTVAEAKAEGQAAPAGRRRKVGFQEYDSPEGKADLPASGPDLLKEARESHGQ